jgi:CheY-like chemotaxis protein
VLLVDDDREFVQATRALLEQHGYEVLTAHDGESAVRVARADYPHVVILDVMMGSPTEGLEVSRRLRDCLELREVPVILLTGMRRTMNLTSSPRPDPEWLPVRAVLEKPVTPGRLLKELDRQFRARQEPRRDAGGT